MSKYYKADTFTLQYLVVYDNNYNLGIFNTTYYPSGDWNITNIAMNDTVGPVLHDYHTGKSFSTGFTVIFIFFTVKLIFLIAVIVFYCI